MLWVLKVKADVPGVNYSDEFELPVFRTSLSPLTTAAFAGGTQIASLEQTTTMSEEISAEVSEPPHLRVFVSESPDGLQFQFAAGRNVARTVLVVSLAAALSALFLGMLRVKPEAPMFAFVVVGLAGFFPDPCGHSLSAFLHTHRRWKRHGLVAALRSRNWQYARNADFGC